MNMPLNRGTASEDLRLAGLDDGTDPFVAAVRATRMPMVITDPRQPDNPIVFVNDSFCRLTGYARKEILGRNCRFLQGPDTDPEAVSQIREAVADRRSIQVDLRNYRKNGEPFWNRLLLGPVQGTDGEVAYFFASQVDVTLERERLVGLETSNAALTVELADRVREIETAESRLRAATDAGELGVWQLELSNAELFASSHCKRNFGRDEHLPFSYRQLQEAVHPDDQPRMRAAVDHTVRTGEDYRIEYRVVRPDGQLAWVRIVGRLERNVLGQPAFMSGISQDITDVMLARRRSELLESLERDVYSAVHDPAEIAYRAAESLGRALDVSRAGFGLVDNQKETIVIERDWNAPGISSLAGTLHFRDFGSYIEDLKQGDSVVISDARRDPRTAATADALIAVSAQALINIPVSEDKGLVALLYLNHATARQWTEHELSLIRDVAQRTQQAVERRRAEQNLQALADSLERKVEERSRELMRTEAALRQAQKMEAVGQLTGGLAHDFNNLLAAISNSLELLKRKLPDEAGLGRYVDIGQNATRRAAALTHRLLAFSRQQTLEPKVVHVNRLIGGFEDLVRRTMGPQVGLEVAASIGTWPIHADRGQLENALLNLCINARDAMPDGGKVVIETENRTLDDRFARELDVPPGPYVSISVRDSGTGMAPGVIARAFDPFFTTKPLGVGTGLGLSMVYGFARQSGGQAHIQSEVGAGTTVFMYLPRHVGDEGSLDEAEHRQPGMVQPGVGETILVVDDESAMRELMSEVLMELGYRVLQAADGQRAVEALHADRSIALLVTDVGLPGGMSGRHVADAARALNPEQRVLFVTGYAESFAIGLGELPQGMQVMTKPFELSTFTQRVQALLRA